MSQCSTLEPAPCDSILKWAVDRRAEITVSHSAERGWRNLRSHFIRYDPEQNVLEIACPLTSAHLDVPKIAVGDPVGVSFRRGHKKCIFVSPTIMRRQEVGADGATTETLVLRAPVEIRQLQRRVYQRVIVGPDWFIGVRIWEGGTPENASVSWPLCSGRLVNVSAGGALVDVRADQNPRLGVGDVVGLEINTRAGPASLRVEGQYRHCTAGEDERLGLGFQFVGLEHDRPGRATLPQVAEFVRSLRRRGCRG